MSALMFVRACLCSCSGVLHQRTTSGNPTVGADLVSALMLVFALVLVSALLPVSARVPISAREPDADDRSLWGNHRLKGNHKGSPYGVMW